jgi:membrane protein required for colicin V production
MSIPDVVLVVIIAGFVFYGFFFGLIRTIGSIAGLAAGAWISVEYHLFFYSHISRIFFGFERAGKIITFIIIFSLVGRLVTLGFEAVDRAMDFMSIVPFFRMLNRVFGATFGLVLGGLVVGLAFRAGMNYGWSSHLISKLYAKSFLVPAMLAVASSGTAALPDSLNWLNASMKNIVNTFSREFGRNL